MIAIFIHMKALPSKRKELVQTVRSLIAEIMIESGCMSVSFLQEVDDENTFLVVERWADQKAAETHLSSKTFTVLKGAGPLMRQKPAVTIESVSQLTKQIEINDQKFFIAVK